MTIITDTTYDCTDYTITQSASQRDTRRCPSEGSSGHPGGGRPSPLTPSCPVVLRLSFCAPRCKGWAIRVQRRRHEPATPARAAASDMVPRVLVELAPEPGKAGAVS